MIGTPERTLTSDLSLRRRSLYTTELLGHIVPIVADTEGSVNDFMLLCAMCNPTNGAEFS